MPQPEPCTDTHCPLHHTDTPHSHIPADDGWHAVPNTPTPEEKLDAVLQQLGILLGVVIQCAACVADARQGGNPQVNLANVIIGGEGLCHTHVDLIGTRLVRRNSSGLILGGN